ncbi:alkaline phytoceramidase [Ophiobolus disseminans]|uniref:Alkaline phytoceramidase n=1 Tax=Ophiobolus disseminans TaxID=1469910 RepID=A0A6A7A3K9_9PLEO|nr:alkaline phytoceramidase [Ophiobolus disseminans]
MGHHNRHFSGDRHALQGAWSPPSSTANFCEEDYAVTRYLAEFINSLTNLIYVYFALRYMYQPKKATLLAPRVDFMSVSLLILGISSFLFHASLRQTLQFADELSMLGLAWSLLQGTLTVRNSFVRTRNINFGLAIVFPLFSAFYVWTGKIIYHATAFAIAISVIVLRGHYLFHWLEPPFPTAKRVDWLYRGINALIYLLVGYFLWNIDLEYCAELRQLREQVGMPWSWCLELHGWWHILTAISASQFMDILRELREEVDNEKKG